MVGNSMPKETSPTGTLAPLAGDNLLVSQCGNLLNFYNTLGTSTSEVS